jgi:hypothetical protein
VQDLALKARALIEEAARVTKAVMEKKRKR